MLGSDFSNVLGTASLITATQADDLANTTDSLNTTALLYGFDGTTWDRLRGDATNGLLVNLGGNNDVTVSGTVTVDCNSSDVTIDNATIAVTQSGTWNVGTVTTVSAVTSITNTVTVNDQPQTSGGLSMHKTISAASTNATNVKASAGQLYAVQVFNTNASARYLKLYDDSGTPTIGTDTPVKTLTVPGNSNGAGMVLNWDKGLVFASGIAFGTTTGIADNDTGAVAANEMAINLDYK